MLKTLVVILALTQLCSLSFAKDKQGIATSSAKPLAQSAEAILQLGTRYENGEGVSRDFTRARELYCDAARLDAPGAYFNLGWMYLNGRGVVRDDMIAVFWLRKAADRGIPQAVNILRLLSRTPAAEKSSCIRVPNSQALPPTEIRRLVAARSRAAGVDPKLVLAVISVESGFDPVAVSAKKARGLMQLTSETAKRFGVRDPFNIDENLRGGINFLGYLIKLFHGDISVALAAYNAGEGAIDEWGGVPPYEETINYVTRVAGMCACLNPRDLGLKGMSRTQSKP